MVQLQKTNHQQLCIFCCSVIGLFPNQSADNALLRDVLSDATIHNYESGVRIVTALHCEFGAQFRNGMKVATTFQPIGPRKHTNMHKVQRVIQTSMPFGYIILPHNMT